MAGGNTKQGGTTALPKFTTFTNFSTHSVKSETFLITSHLSCSDWDTEKVGKAHMLALGMSLLLPPALSTPVSAHTDTSNTEDWPKADLITPQQCRSPCLPRKLTLREARNLNHWKGTCSPPPLVLVLLFWRLKCFIGKRPDPTNKLKCL